MDNPNFKTILEHKIKYYGRTEAAYEFAAEEYARQLMGTFINEYEMFKALDNFIHHSKGINTPLRNKLIKKINEFLKENKLDTDQHKFIDLSKLDNN